MKTADHPYFAKAMQGFLAGVAAADPYQAVVENLPSFAKPPVILAVGKAASKMAQAAVDHLPDYDRVIVVTNPENATALPFATVFAAAHPVPDQIGLTAGASVIEAAMAANLAKLPILCLISGGGSALLPAPAGGITLAEKAEVNRLLLASGADIERMNLVRQQLSKLKGGGLLEYAGDSPVTALILSDVIGDDVRAIASGPTASPIGTAEQAIGILQDIGVWQDVPIAVQKHLQTVKPRPIRAAQNVIIGSNSKSLAAVSWAIPDAVAHPRPLTGLVDEAAHWVAKLALGAHVFGGETTVILKGNGKGGRNQDMALRVALLAEKNGWVGPWLYLQAGTDGRDGPTDAAGGVVHEASLAKIRAAGLDPHQMLDNNDAYPALKAADGLVLTGGTGTNVADLGILIRG